MAVNDHNQDSGMEHVDLGTVLVTGGTSGIGHGVVSVLAGAGWSVIATGRTEAEIHACAGRENVRLEALDVTDQASVDRLFETIGSLDGLVNCAGILMRGQEMDLANFETVIAVNLTGTMRICLTAQPLLASSGGAIVNTASMLTFFGGPLVPAYSASKGGVGQLTRSLAAAWAGDGIRVNAVAPGWIETPMTEGLRDDAARSATILGRTPMQRWGQPDEVGEAVAWLLSDAARFVTGAIIPVDGGYSAV